VKLERDFHRVDTGLTKDLTQHAQLRRRLDDVVGEIGSDYDQCSQSPPDAPGWAEAVGAVEKLGALGDRSTQRVLDELQRTAAQGQRKATAEYRKATAERHKILARMAPKWKAVRDLSDEMAVTLKNALAAVDQVNTHMDHYEGVRKASPPTMARLRRSAINLFIISTFVMAVAAAGGFINFQLIALPMSELVPAGSRVSGVPVSTVAALIVVLMEVTAGIFLMEMLGITSLFPRLHNLPASRKRLIGGISALGLLFLSGIEASLAVLREQIVATESAVTQALAGQAAATADTSMIPVIGQAVLGFTLPWILAMIAIPLETFISTGSYVLGSLMAAVVAGVGHVLRLCSHVMRYAARMIQHLLDAYIAIPIQIEAALRGSRGAADEEASDRRGWWILGNTRRTRVRS
jgi:hypothetical protein